MKALVIGDALEKLKPAGDTSLVILHELKAEKIETFYCVEDDLVWDESGLSVNALPVEQSERGKLPNVGAKEQVPVLNFKWVFIRKDPPFDQSYVKLCWLLSPFENEIQFVNQPSLLLRYHEKMLPLEGVRQNFLRPKDLIPTCLSATFEGAKDFVAALSTEKVVLKPYFGFGGNDVFLLNRKNFQKEAAAYFAMSKDWIIQPFEDSVFEKGDARVFFIHGKFSGGFARLPKEGSHISNLAQGGASGIA